MIIIKFICFLIIIIGIGFGFEILLRKILKTSKKAWESNQRVNQLQKRGELVLLVLFLIILGAQIFLLDDLWYWTLPIYLMITTLFRCFMEWKYDRQSKEYIVTLSQLVFWSLLFFIIVYFKLFI